MITDDQHWQHATGDCALNKITFEMNNALGISFYVLFTLCSISRLTLRRGQAGAVLAGLAAALLGPARPLWPVFRHLSSWL